MNTIDKKLLLGRWTLRSFKLHIWGMSWDWGRNARGYLHYNSDDTMHVDIAAQRSWLPHIGQVFFDNRLTYEGTYELIGDVVKHHLMASSKKSWIGKELERTVVKIDSNWLILAGTNGYSTYSLIWAKA